MWFLVTQPFLSFDLVGSLPQIPPQTPDPLPHLHSIRMRQLSLPGRRRIRLRQCHSIDSERLGLSPVLGYAVVNHRSWIVLCTSTTCVICLMTRIFCTAFSRRFLGIHRLVLNLIGSRWRWDCYWCLRSCTRFSPSSRGKLHRYAVVKRAHPSCVLAISASSRARHPLECP